MAIKLNVNGQNHEMDVASETPPLWVLRDVLGMTGTKYGCGIQHCHYFEGDHHANRGTRAGL
jgi:isoquinoline 1-oxidoreductase alpha subunit